MARKEKLLVAMLGKESEPIGKYKNLDDRAVHGAPHVAVAMFSAGAPRESRPFHIPQDYDVMSVKFWHENNCHLQTSTCLTAKIFNPTAKVF